MILTQTPPPKTKLSFQKSIQNLKQNLPFARNIIAPKLAPLKQDTLQISFKGDKAVATPIDKDLELLKGLTEALKANPDNKKLKQLLFDQEKVILDQELTETSKYIKRCFDTNGINPRYTNIPTDVEDLQTQIQMNALIGLSAYYHTVSSYGYEIKDDANMYYPIFEDMIKNKPEDSFLGTRIKNQVMINSKFMYKFMDDKNKEKYEGLALHLLENSTNKQLQEAAMNFFVDFVDKKQPTVLKAQELFSERYNNTNLSTEERKTALKIMGKLCAPQLSQLAPKIFNSKEAENDFELKEIAIWAAGSVPSEENLELISDIITSRLINNTAKLDDTEQAFFEIALSSLVKHKDINAKQVINLLENVKENCEQLSLLADHLLGIARGQKHKEDFLVNKEITSAYKKDHYKQMRNQFVDGLKHLNDDPKHLNHVDQALLPMREMLLPIVNLQAKLTILNDTCTAQRPNLIGIRTGDGRFYDMVDGIANLKELEAVTGSSNITNDYESQRIHITAHEFGHLILYILKQLDHQEYEALEEIFNTKEDEGRFIEHYASANIDEYFAVGYELYTQERKPHKYAIDAKSEDSKGHTKYVLQRQDPKLYNFVEHIIQKYGQTEGAFAKVLMDKLKEA